jgi:glycerol-3-phosphate dehydrogenase
MRKTVETDIVIIGGGISGLWLLNRLRQLGFSVVLLESAALGSGQTLKSQGIIHGGMKFALQGKITPATQAIATMPAIWEQCLQGSGQINLARVPILSQHQYLWSPNKLIGKLSGFFAGLTLQGSVRSLSKEAYPLIFQHPQFKGLVYSLAEMVIDVPALIQELAKPHEDVIFKIDPLHEDNLNLNEMGRLDTLDVQALPNELVKIKAQKYIFAAGAGNELLVKKLQLKHDAVGMQRRPLHMVVVKTDFSYPLFAHCMGASAVPRITITTHQAHDGKTVWYLGGQIAEEGVKRDPESQIRVAKEELQSLFSWLDFTSAQFASFLIDRAEPLQPDGKRPDNAYTKEIENMFLVWPVKLALVPKLAEDVIASLQQARIEPKIADIDSLRPFSMPAYAPLIWNELL